MQHNDPRLATLGTALEELSELLQRHGESWWGAWAESRARQFARLPYATIPLILGAFGGMGSFNDLILDPRHGHLGSSDELDAADGDLCRLRHTIYEHATAMRHDSQVDDVPAFSLSASTVLSYLRQAMAGMARALDRFDDRTVNVRPHGDQTNSAAILITHACASSRYWVEHIGLGQVVERDRSAEFVATATVDELRRLLNETTEALSDGVVALAHRAEPNPHEWRDTLVDRDTSDASLVSHVFEELYQHLGHLELTADALATPPT